MINTEKERIQAEELIFTQDYLEFISRLVDYSDKIPGREYDSMMKDLVAALHEKVSYILDASEKYRHKLGFWERRREMREAKKLERELLLKHQEEQAASKKQNDGKKEDAVLTPNFIALSEFSQNSALLETKDDRKLIENLKNTNAQDEGQCMSF